MVFPKHVPREEWGAKNPVWVQPLGRPLDYLVMEVTGTRTCFNKQQCIRTMKILQRDHMKEEGVPDIKYNFCVGGDGLVYEGRGWHTQVIHSNPEQASESWRNHDWNGKSLIFAYIGPYDKMPNQDVSIVMRDLITEALTMRLLKTDFLRIPGFFTKPKPKTTDTKKDEEEKTEKSAESQSSGTGQTPNHGPN